MFRLTYEESCTGCGNCVVACPINISLDPRTLGGKGGGSELKIKDGNIYIETISCNGCGICIQSCPFNALKLEVKEPVTTKRTEKIFEELREERMEKILERKEVRYKINERILQDLEVASKSFSTGILGRIIEGEQKITPVEVRDLIEIFERKGNVFGILDEQVISKDFCSLCGACVAACPEEAIEIEIKDGPSLVKECTSCASCLLRCPKTALIRVEIGRELGFFSARSMKKEVLHATEFGGATTSLLLHALKEGIVDCAIITRKEHPVLTSNPSEIIEIGGIKFAISPVVSLLREAVRRYKKIAVVGTPCQVTAARKFQLLGFGEIKLILGVFCPRGKREKSSPLACKLCTDFTAELSDISLGSTGSAKGWRSVLIRTELGEELVRSAVRAAYIQITELDKEGILKIAKMERKKKDTGISNRKDILRRYGGFEEAVKSLGGLNVGYLSIGLGEEIWSQE